MTQSNDRDQKPTTPREVPMEKHEQGHNLGDPGKQQQQGSPKPGGNTQQGGSRNEGEGNRTAAKQYNAHVQQSAANPEEVKREAEAARLALDGAEGAELAQAEKAGCKPARR
jgi:hypothetical protein